jgi:small neutral amino acid transporter SnatA (MarC family)
MHPFIASAALLFVLLNPFLMSIYLIDLFEDLDWPTFRSALLRGAAIATAVFVAIAWIGEAVFRQVLQVHFASFLIFGGAVFLMIGLRIVFNGSDSLRMMRAQTGPIADSVAFPSMIGPGTVWASVLAGEKLGPLPAVGAVALSVSLSVGAILVLKRVHDAILGQHHMLVRRYFELTGRVMGLVIGSFAMEMIAQGICLWWRELQ